MPPPTASPPAPPPTRSSASDTGTPRGSPALRSIALACAAAALVHALWTAWASDWTTDEPVHLEWSARLLSSGESERSSRPWFNATTPVSVPNVLGQRLAARLGVESEAGLRFAARLPTVLWFLLLLVLGHRFLHSLAGPVAASLWSIAVALDPNLTAHFSLATVDAAFALATLLAAWAATRFIAAPSSASAVALGLALGAAMTAKVTGVLLVAMVLPLVLLLALLQRTAVGYRTLGLGTVGVGLAAWLAVCLGYGFVGIGEAAAHAWQSPLLTTLFGTLPALPALVPAGFVTGVDECLVDERSMHYNVVILGQHHGGPVWYYFVILWLVKTPLALLALTLVGLVAGFRLGRRGPLLGRVENRFLLILIGLLLAYFSLRFRTQLGYRFVLMCLPLLYALSSQGLARLPLRPATRVAGPLLLLLAILPQLPYLGDPLAFTNGLVWDKSRAYRVVADSNLDWGQNDHRVDRWSARHPGAHLDPYHLLPGLNVIGANRLLGLLPPDRHRWLRQRRRPDRHLHHTHLLFTIDQATFRSFLAAERRLDPGWLDRCVGGDVGGRLLAADEARALAAPAPGEGLRLTCLALEREADLVLEATTAGGAAGFRLRDGRCILDPLDGGQQAWYRLAAGSYTLCRRGAGEILLRAGAEGVRIGE